MKILVYLVAAAFVYEVSTGVAVAQPPVGTESDGSAIQKNVHPLFGAGADLFAPPVGSTGTITPPILYHGGALLGTPNVYFIWYGNWNQSNGSDNSAGQQILRDLATGLNNSRYFQINETYAASGGAPTGGVNFVHEATDTGSKGTRLSDSAVQSVVTTAINNSSLPYDANGVYFVLTSSNVNETSGFCTQYCGWHTSATVSGRRIRFAFVGNANRCLGACSVQTIGPNGNAGVDAMASVVSHELEEATTDPDPSSGWTDRTGAENADKCAWTFGTSTLQPSGAYYNVTLGTHNFLIQRNLRHSTTGDVCSMN